MRGIIAHIFIMLIGCLLFSCEQQNAAEAERAKPPSPVAEFRSLRSASDATDARAARVVAENPLYFRQRVYYQLLEEAVRAQKNGIDSLLHAKLDEAEAIAAVFKEQLNDPFLYSQLQFTTSLSEASISTKIAVDSLYALANDSLKAKNHSAANDLFEESIRLALKIGDKRRVVDNRLRQQYMLQRQKRLKESIAYGKQAISVALESGYQYRSAWIFHYMALASRQAGNYSAAVDYSNQSAKAAQFTRDDRCLTDTRWVAGTALHHLGKYSESISVFKEALQASKRRGGLSIQAKIHNSIAHSYKSLGNYSQSEHHYLDSWKIFDELQRPLDVATSQSNLADLYRVMGAHDEAMQMFRMAYNNYEINEDSFNQIATIKRIADTYYDQGEMQLARESCRSALNRITAQEKAGSDAYALLKQEVYLRLGDTERDMNSTAIAMPLYEKALSNLIKLDNPYGILEGHLKIGDLHLRNKKLQAAHTSLLEAAAIARRINHPRAMALADFSLGKLFIQQGKYIKADQALVRAINGVEQTRSGLEDEKRLNELQISYFATMQDIYNEMIQLQLKRKRPEEAFYYSEQARSRSLRDLMQNTAQQALPAVNIESLQKSLSSGTVLLEYKFLKDQLAAFIVCKDTFSATVFPASQQDFIEVSI
ncbi:MAG: tetratricopeptide repeat protein, partial [Calditrichota bacterium]